MNEQESVKNLNPWLSIWVKPRETMRQVFGTGAALVHMLILIGVLVEALDQAVVNSTGDDGGWANVGIYVVATAIIGYLLVYFIISPLLGWVGRKIGGTGTTERVRYALAYSYIPYVYSLVLIWIPSLLLFGEENFTTAMPIVEGSIGLSWGYAALALVDMVIGIWALVITLKCIGEAHEFSAWKALGAIILMVLPIFLLAFVFGIIGAALYF